MSYVQVHEVWPTTVTMSRPRSPMVLSSILGFSVFLALAKLFYEVCFVLGHFSLCVLYMLLLRLVFCMLHSGSPPMSKVYNARLLGKQ